MKVFIVNQTANITIVNCVVLYGTILRPPISKQDPCHAFEKLRGIDLPNLMITIRDVRARKMHAGQPPASEMETHEYRSSYRKATPTWESCQGVKFATKGWRCD